MKLLTIVGARPQFIKAAAVSRVLSRGYSSVVEERLLHTGQHYDTGMSDVFFDELGLPRPAVNLGVGSASHGVQTARMLEGIERELLGGAYDAVLVYGDTNSTLAGALAASKLGVPVFHVEAGLRSRVASMPEEQNRIVADHLSARLYAPTITAVDNLRGEGLGSRTALVGDVMLDNAMHYAPIARRGGTLRRLGLVDGSYALATVHRAANTDTPGRLRGIFDGLAAVASRFGVKVVAPLHPRTLRCMAQAGVECGECVVAVPPAGYLDMLALEQGAAVVLTDSGGVQKEAYFLGRPSVILRDETEWTEIVDQGAACLAAADPGSIADAYAVMCRREPSGSGLFGDGSAAVKIVNDMLKNL